jgi:leader peptidase (prepilin peptidase)/N-methyltransferase
VLFRSNVPVLSWVLLRGRCRDCGTRISARYPGVELLTAVVFALLAARFGAAWALPAFLYLAAVGVALAFIDYDTRRLPDVIVLPSIAVGAVLLLAPAAGQAAWGSYVRALLGALVLFGFYFVVWFVYPKGMGFGDVKLAGLLGLHLAWLGWGALVVGAFLGFLIGAVVGVALMIGHRAGRRSAIPFGPSMCAGALLGILIGPAIAGWYFGLLAF